MAKSKKFHYWICIEDFGVAGVDFLEGQMFMLPEGKAPRGMRDHQDCWLKSAPFLLPVNLKKPTKADKKKSPKILGHNMGGEFWEENS